MQLFFLPEWLMIALFFVLWFIFQGGAGLLCVHLPRRVFAQDGWLYKTRRWENGGQIYQTLFRIKRWKGLLPDGGALFKNGYSKKHLASADNGNLELYVLESRRAELTHWLAILPFPVFGLFAPLRVVPIMLLYALAINLPCIIAQRYNRPRVQRILQRRGQAAGAPANALPNPGTAKE